MYRDLESMCRRLESPVQLRALLPAPSSVTDEVRPIANGDTKPLAERLAAIR
jgi:hypothetical protein